MKKALTAIIFAAFLFTAAASFAANGDPCTFDTECFPGQCIKNAGSLSGICAGDYN